MLDFSGAPSEQFSGDLIPEKTLAWAILNLRPYNGQQGIAETPSQGDPNNAYLDVELTIVGGRYDKRKVWEKLHVKNSEKAANQARAQIRAILEVGKGANIQTNPQGYHIADYFGLDGLKVAIEVGFEKGTQGYKDKNTVKTFLTPNPDIGSASAAKWDALLKGNEALMYPPASAIAANNPQAGGQGALPLANSQATGWNQTQGGNQSPASSTPGISPSNAPAADPNKKPAWL